MPFVYSDGKGNFYSSTGELGGKDPTVQPFVKPWMYSPQVAKDQQTTFNPMSTSLNYLARFGVAKHF